jgi:hypothetical protein
LGFLAEKFACKEEVISERNHDAGPHTALEESLNRLDYLRGRQVQDWRFVTLAGRQRKRKEIQRGRHGSADGRSVRRKCRRDGRPGTLGGVCLGRCRRIGTRRT